MRRWSGRFALLALGLLAAALLTPEGDPGPLPDPGYPRFAWDQGELFDELEARFDAARETDCDPTLDDGLAAIDQRLDELAAVEVDADDPRLGALETDLFTLAARFGGCSTRLAELEARTARVRRVVKRQSRGWALGERRQRNVLYRLLYGSRAAIEELVLASDAEVPPSIEPDLPPSEGVPSAIVEGVRVESGDVLLSRGGAPTSAMIARGNDYPGNFSHVALLHVSKEGVVSVIESHIESGVSARGVEAYLEDTKLRILVLRLRRDHPRRLARPSLPHDAASRALADAASRHIPYDFPMNYHDPSAQFCSEVASAAYRTQNVLLWQNLSSMSAPGLARWLNQVGVRYLETHAPSDLEYDPAMEVVAEWRDPETLFDDHLDGAMLDAMLEGADRGDPLSYRYARLPLARLAKGYSVVLNGFGAVGPVPEGMSATTGLRIEYLGVRHAALRAGMTPRVAAYRAERGRRPPYWTLLDMARAALAELGTP